mmetsp:Transcript_41221/g.119376  ORF Transcript_41221/g.119376 Transcript_41221/m.119376 type:complete len:278 (+) Transcript_41221:770-1603(+)
MASTSGLASRYAVTRCVKTMPNKNTTKVSSSSPQTNDFTVCTSWCVRVLRARKKRMMRATRMIRMSLVIRTTRRIRNCVVSPREASESPLTLAGSAWRVNSTKDVRTMNTSNMFQARCSTLKNLRRSQNSRRRSSRVNKMVKITPMMSNSLGGLSPGWCAMWSVSTPMKTAFKTMAKPKTSSTFGCERKWRKRRCKPSLRAEAHPVLMKPLAGDNQRMSSGLGSAGPSSSVPSFSLLLLPEPEDKASTHLGGGAGACKLDAAGPMKDKADMAPVMEG